LNRRAKSGGKDQGAQFEKIELQEIITITRNHYNYKKSLQLQEIITN
jgi:hypothetical protein